MAISPLNLNYQYIDKEIVIEEAIHITKTMLFALVLADSKYSTFEQFAKKHIISDIDEMIKATDSLTQEIFKNLVDATEIRIMEVALPLLKVFEVLNAQNSSNQYLFIASFVLPVAHHLRSQAHNLIF
jgi:hypothetical protein